MKLNKCANAIFQLASVNRYSDHRLVNDESVLEHSGFVCMMALFISESIKDENPNIEINQELLLKKAILHDFDEIITGDIAMPIKYHSKELRDLIGEMEHEAVDKISKDLFGNNFIYNVWSTSKSGKEGGIVSLCDALAVLYKIYDETILRGNLTVGHIAVNADKSIQLKIKRLEDHFGILEVFDYINSECMYIVNQIKRKLK